MVHRSLYERSARIVLCAWAAAVISGAGCARERGPLFLQFDPPRVWPGPPERARIRHLGVLRGSQDLNAGVSGLEVIKAALRGPRPAIQFSGPHSVAVSLHGLLAVADGAGAAVHVIDPEGRTHLVVSGWEEERFGVPIGVAWAGERLFVTDAQRHEVIELDAGGQVRRRFGSDKLVRPVGIAYAGHRDRLYVVDGGAHCVQVFDLCGRHVERIGQRGARPGQFNFPSHVCCDNERLLVSDSGNFRVQLLDLDGGPIRVFGQKGDAAGDFALPKGVGFDSEGNIYVVDARFEIIQVFDDSGRLLLAFGQEGLGPGEFWLPAGLAIDARDRIWVADAGNRRIQVFQYVRSDP